MSRMGAKGCAPSELPREVKQTGNEPYILRPRGNGL
jgi:hypothetical protein